ncbi:MAG: UvrB/UvrC motif-containing protein [Planctomycetaceae bacterium]
MKKCRRCHKPATLHITEIKEGEIRALHLCEVCAQDYLSNVEAGDVNAEEPDKLPGGFEAESKAEQDESCPHCGITYKQFRSRGRLGCPHDYDVFRERLGPLLESIHGERQHIGKSPQSRPSVSRRQHELVRLRGALKGAVEAEDYEQAAQLRDEIRQLESGEETGA